jgi:hypothetical protein
VHSGLLRRAVSVEILTPSVEIGSTAIGVSKSLILLYARRRSRTGTPFGIGF